MPKPKTSPFKAAYKRVVAKRLGKIIPEIKREAKAAGKRAKQRAITAKLVKEAILQSAKNSERTINEEIALLKKFAAEKRIPVSQAMRIPLWNKLKEDPAIHEIIKAQINDAKARYVSLGEVLKYLERVFFADEMPHTKTELTNRIREIVENLDSANWGGLPQKPLRVG